MALTKLELVVVVAVACVFAGAGVALAHLHGSVDGPRERVLCKSNLRSIAISIENYRNRFKRYPKTRSGVDFLLAPFREGLFPRTEKVIRNLYVCPGDRDAVKRFPGAETWHAEVLRGNVGLLSYAGRNTVDYPLTRENAAAEIIACDAAGVNGERMAHRGFINVAYLDMSVGDIRVAAFDPSQPIVGPNAPLEQLRKLNKVPPTPRIEFDDSGLRLENDRVVAARANARFVKSAGFTDRGAITVAFRHGGGVRARFRGWDPGEGDYAVCVADGRLTVLRGVAELAAHPVAGDRIEIVHRRVSAGTRIDCTVGDRVIRLLDCTSPGPPSHWVEFELLAVGAWVEDVHAR